MKQAETGEFGRSLLRGFGRLLDIRGATARPYPRRHSLGAPEADVAAADWNAVFNDFGEAFTRVKRRDAAASHGQ
jgi:hypothetical protein